MKGLHMLKNFFVLLGRSLLFLPSRNRKKKKTHSPRHPSPKLHLAHRHRARMRKSSRPRPSPALHPAARASQEPLSVHPRGQPRDAKIDRHQSAPTITAITLSTPCPLPTGSDRKLSVVVVVVGFHTTIGDLSITDTRCLAFH
jgi:hypothetical protein